MDQYKSMVPLLAYQTLSSQIKDPLIYLQLYGWSHLIEIQDPRNQDLQNTKIS